MLTQSEQLFKELTPMLPVLIPLSSISLLLLAYTLWHILTHKSYKRGTRALWVVLSFIAIVGPILYLTLGKSDE